MPPGLAASAFARATALVGSTGQLPTATNTALRLRFESALALGDVWALHELWHELAFDRLSAVFRRAR